MARIGNTELMVLVTGATGHQGGAVARHLLRRGFQVHALTRDANKHAARALAAQGATIVEGSLDERADLERAVAGAYGVFSVQNFWETGYEREVKQGKLLADVANSAGVRHFVYSSVASAHRRTGLSHFESKWDIEQHIHELGMPYSILRPVFFMQNWQNWRDAILAGTLAQPLSPDRRLQQIDVDDIGAFAAMAFEDPAKWLGRELDIAGDEPSMREVAETFGNVLGRPVMYVQITWEQFEKAAGEEYTKMYRWFDNVGYDADIAALRSEYPQLATFEESLRRQGWSSAEIRAAA